MLSTLPRTDLAAKERHRPEDRLTQAASVDPDGAVETIWQRLPVDGASDAVGEPGDAGKAHRQIDRHDALAAAVQRKAQRKIGIRGARVLQKQSAPDRPEPDAECVGVGDLGPEPHGGAADGHAGAGPHEPDFRIPIGRLLESRRLDQRRQLLESRTAQQHETGERATDESSHHGHRLQTGIRPDHYPHILRGTVARSWWLVSGRVGRVWCDHLREGATEGETSVVGRHRRSAVCSAGRAGAVSRVKRTIALSSDGSSKPRADPRTL
jgi:hypothetical protein